MAVTLKVEERATRPRSLRNKLRHEGKIPGVVYGYQVENTAIAVEDHELMRLLRENGANTVFSMDLNGKKVNTLLHDYQSETFTREFTHVEFLSVDMAETTEVETEIVLVGEAAGVKAGGTLAQTLYTIVVSATPDKLPENIEVDITDLQIGQSITVGDLAAHADYTVITDAEEQVAAIQGAQEESAELEVPGEAAEPEVIGETEAE
ncbi:50S ribosomal protein L25/general stress protein Ctc [Enterococcus sp. 669A]|uniref:Large ribosomal subunit protein bL25 n=1 Tax=Candidatus Enterococcus moelleringii TaxID=2815325 RepID=A0ABS3L833_9ENTE|nr:50S ribosomal protein L25/general stress protein Ctc [Enterococcus sp. 669A]MBO1305786.1 50S ribosomal protein L25/general stress protein Ctc [Enterococcus sp. 669A]